MLKYCASVGVVQFFVLATLGLFYDNALVITQVHYAIELIS